MIYKTKRLTLRPWRVSDDEALYNICKNSSIGLNAGFMPHTSVTNSHEIIKNILSKPNTFAICLDDNIPIGSLGIHKYYFDESNKEDKYDLEIGYWIKEELWGNGYATEALRWAMEFAFKDLGAKVLWCGHFEENIRSKKVQEKCGFKFDHKVHKHFDLIDQNKTECINKITKEEYLKTML